MGNFRHLDLPSPRPFSAATLLVIEVSRLSLPGAAAVEDSVRVFLAIVAIALLTGAAHAQGMTGAGKRGQNEQAADQQRRQQKAAEAEKAYKAGLEKIPNADTKQDPWADVRSAQPGKSNTKSK
jgi:hypothetical protein